MSNQQHTQIELTHRLRYSFNRPVQIGPQLVRLLPANHTRANITHHRIHCEPEPDTAHTQRDPSDSTLLRWTFQRRLTHLDVHAKLRAEIPAINPFDFLIEPESVRPPMRYPPGLRLWLAPCLRIDESDWGNAQSPSSRDNRTHHLMFPAAITADLVHIQKTSPDIIALLVALNQWVHAYITYTQRSEPGIQTVEQTLLARTGSCRDLAWLLIVFLRYNGIAARFVSGYAARLEAEHTGAELHAWVEAYLPGAGWVGLDPTSGLLTDARYIPLACAPAPESTAVLSGSVEPGDHQFEYSVDIRIISQPQIMNTESSISISSDRKPTDTEYAREIDQLLATVGTQIETALSKSDVSLTMGGEPTFTYPPEQEAPEWNTAALGGRKQELADSLLLAMESDYAGNGLLFHGDYKWYPGEYRPRWARGLIYRADGDSAFEARHLLIGSQISTNGLITQSEKNNIAANDDATQPASAPAEETILETITEFTRLLCAHLGIPDDCMHALQEENGSPFAFAVPLYYLAESNAWLSFRWDLPTPITLLSGDADIGYRIPFLRLPRENIPERPFAATHDPSNPDLPALPSHAEYMRLVNDRFQKHTSDDAQKAHSMLNDEHTPVIHAALCVYMHSGFTQTEARHDATNELQKSNTNEKLQGTLYHKPIHVFLPPLRRAEEFLELIAAVEATAQRMSPSPRMVFTGYLPPLDRRLPRLLITPDPGVLEVNLPPSDDIHSAARMLRRLYQHADRLNLRAHRYEHNGLPRGSGGGHHITLGGPTPARSIFLREPALLRSMITYFQHHPALSYLFAGHFIGPTSQAPRVDEARQETLTELELAFKNLPDNQTGLLWEAGRRLGHLLVDVTGNTHRSEFCVDKLFPEAPLEMRQGLLELRAFESLPTADMTIVLYILIRALATHLHQSAYHHPFRRFGQTLHDHFLLPHFLEQDLLSVLGDLKNAGFYIPARLFQPHYEFRFPLYARLPIGPGHIEIRQALECWNVLGSDPGHSTARPVDASLDRLEIKLIGLPAHFLLVCNRQYVPLLKLDAGNRIGAVRFKARRPPTGTLHPWMPVHTPLCFRVIDTDSHPYQSIADFSYYEDYSEVPPTRNRVQTEQKKADPCLRAEESGQRMARRLVISDDMEPVNITPEMLASQIMNHTDDAVTLDLRFTS